MVLRRDSFQPNLCEREKFHAEADEDQELEEYLRFSAELHAEAEEDHC